MNQIIEAFLYTVLYVFVIFGIHKTYIYIKNNYTEPVIIDSKTQNNKYDELIKHMKESQTIKLTSSNDITNDTDELANIFDIEFETNHQNISNSDNLENNFEI